MSWAIVIGIDEYGDPGLRLDGAVADARRFRDWVLAADGGRVPSSNLRLLLGRRPDDPGSEEATAPTKDNIVTAVNDVVTAAAEGAERLFFYFAGHGLTARVANRDEGALVTPGFDELHPDHSLAIRSLTEYFETTPFADQFFFVDACRNIPWGAREFEIGRWPVPRRRDPGRMPVQQFVLYSTSPGLTSAEVGWPDDATGVFTDVLMRGLAGGGRAKAWSWERDCYEVRWDRLTEYVGDEMKPLGRPATPPAGVPGEDLPVQLPQDTGARGVANRDRDALLVSFPRGHFRAVELTLELRADPRYDEAEVQVLDAVGEPVASALKVVGTSVTFSLAPKTYAARAVTIDQRVGRVIAPIELYEPLTTQVELRPRAAPADETMAARDATPDAAPDATGTISVTSADPLSTAEIRDEAGRVIAVVGSDGDPRELRPGFYRVRQVGPERAGSERFVVLSAGEAENVALVPPAPTPAVTALARALGGHVEDGHVVPVPGAEAAAWAQPSTVVVAGIGAALDGVDGAASAIGLMLPAEARRADRGSVAAFAVADDGERHLLGGLTTRVWPVGEPVPERAAGLRLTAAGIAANVMVVPAPAQYWISLERDGGAPTVAALPVMAGRLATFVVQLGTGGLRSHQVHPSVGPGPSAAPDRLRRMELLQRLLLSGRLDGAALLAGELAAASADDPFAGCLAGYTFLRLGLHDELGALASTLVDVAPGLSDAYVLRGEHEAAAGRTDAAAQAFADAIAAGIPAFGEGLTRLVEGLRVSGFNHPRGWLVRHVFQRHARGSMWAAFIPRRGLVPGGPVISAADLGFAG